MLSEVGNSGVRRCVISKVGQDSLPWLPAIIPVALDQVVAELTSNHLGSDEASHTSLPAQVHRQQRIERFGFLH